MSKRLLQVILVMLGLVLLVAGVWGLIGGIADEFYAINLNRQLPGHLILDSNLRFFSGLSLGLGIILCWLIPSIEKQKSTFRLLSLMIFIGGLGRVISMIMIGLPSPLFVLFTLLELLFPLLIVWQNQLTKSYPQGDQDGQSI